MAKELEKEMFVVGRITDLIKNEYLDNAELNLQINKDAKDSIIIKVGNNSWRNGVIKGDLLFGRIKAGGKTQYLQIKKKFSSCFDRLNVAYTSNKTEQNEDMIRIDLSVFCDLLEAPTDLFIDTVNSIFIDNVSFTSFGCCSKYAECEKRGKCQHTDKLYATACQWQKHLKRSGRFDSAKEE